MNVRGLHVILEHADTWRLRRAIIPDGWFAPRGQPVPGA